MLDKFLHKLVVWGVSISDIERYREIRKDLERCCSDVDVEMCFEQLEMMILIDYPNLPDEFRQELKDLCKGYGVDFI